MKNAFLFVFVYFGVSVAIASSYPQQSFACVGRDFKANVLLQTSGQGELTNSSKNSLLDTVGRRLIIGYQGNYAKEFTTFSTHRRSNGTYIEFIFPSSAHNKILSDIPATFRVIQRRNILVQVEVVCQSSVSIKGLEPIINSL